MVLIVAIDPHMFCHPRHSATLSAAEEYEAEFSHDTLHGFVIGESADPNVMTNNATLDDGSDSDSNRDSQCSDEVFEISRSFSGSASEDDEARQEVPMWCWVNWFALAKGAPLRVGC